MSAFIIILAYIFVIFEALWYLTCTEHKNIPLILTIAVVIFSLIPGVNLIMAVINIIALCIMTEDGCIKLKNNWFNRKFLALHE